jgi:hypothetical protein
MPSIYKYVAVMPDCHYGKGGTAIQGSSMPNVLELRRSAGTSVMTMIASVARRCRAATWPSAVATLTPVSDRVTTWH